MEPFDIFWNLVAILSTIYLSQFFGITLSFSKNGIEFKIDREQFPSQVVRMMMLEMVRPITINRVKCQSMIDLRRYKEKQVRRTHTMPNIIVS